MGQVQRAVTAAGLDHGHLARPVNLFELADPLVETNKIGAAAKQDVLAIVDDLVDAWMQIRACAAPKITAPLDESHAEPRLSECARGAHAGNAAAYHRHCLV